ncbi:MAG TPA: hypothetical protein HPP83_10470, partial [Candidatus Hydrogenedentes bacterium]|nr:hypothetical protein [Candidatus Hydrogenedentota bacterium]
MIESSTEYVPHGYFPFGFPISRAARDVYGASAPRAGGILADHIGAVRGWAARIDARGARGPIDAGQLIAMGLLAEVLRFVVDKYCETYPGVTARGLDWVRGQTDKPTVEGPPKAFVHLFPPNVVYDGGQDEAAYLAKDTVGRPNRDIVTEELLLLRVAVDNPALDPFQHLFDDTELRGLTPYLILTEELERFLEGQPAFPPLSKKLSDLLR